MANIINKHKTNTTIMARRKQTKGRNIEQGGLRLVGSKSDKILDIILQMPNIFYLDLQKFQQAVLSAKSIDYPSRTRLYDLYESADLDLHYKGVLAKRLRGVTRIPIEFHRDGKPDDIITPQLKSPWFKEVRREIVLSQFWGFSLLDFYVDEYGNIKAESISRKHYNPVTRELLRYQDDHTGTPIEEFANTLVVGSGERNLGDLLDIMIGILYKRGSYSDWAQFCNVFGIPIREYTYDAGDEEARLRLIADARRQGASAVYIHPKESELKIHEPKNASATGDLFEKFVSYWDSKISIRVLGNTLTTDAKATGTQALGTVHKEVEDEMNEDDRDMILDVLNYQMRPLFARLGFNVEGGEFVYIKKNKQHPTQQVDIVLKLHSIGLPISDDYLYDFSGIPKPDNYDELIAQKEAEKKAIQAQLERAGTQNDENNKDEDDLKGDDKTRGNTPPKPKNGLRNTLSRFFGLAPHKGGADNDF